MGSGISTWDAAGLCRLGLGAVVSGFRYGFACFPGCLNKKPVVFCFDSVANVLFVVDHPGHAR